MRDRVLYGIISLLVISSLYLGIEVYSLNKQAKELGLQIGENRITTTKIVDFLNQALANQK